MRELKRVFSVGFELEDGRVQNTEFDQPDSSLGHDLIYWDPSVLLEEYEAILSGADAFVEGDEALEFTRALERRRTEFHDHLRGGKAIVVAIPPPRTLKIAGGIDQADLELQLLDPLRFLPDEAEVRAARGKAFELIEGQKFAEFWEWAEEISTYECYFQNPPGTPLLRIAGTDKVVAAAVPVHSGVVLYLPRVMRRFGYQDGSDRDRPDVLAGEDAAHKDFLNLLWEACQQFLRDGLAKPLSLPSWTDKVSIPGEQDAVEAQLRAQQRLSAAERAIQRQEQKIVDLRERKLLFCGTGAALEKVVSDGFSALGFQVEYGQPGRTDRILKRKRRTAVVEIKGKSKSASERDAAQLEKWKSEFHAEHGRSPKGILVVNAWRNKPLEEREKLVAFPDQMLNFAVDLRQQCLLTGLQLLGLWLEAEAHPDKADDLAQSIMACEGIYPGYQDWREVLQIADSGS